MSMHNQNKVPQLSTQITLDCWINKEANETKIQMIIDANESKMPMMITALEKELVKRTVMYRI